MKSTPPRKHLIENGAKGKDVRTLINCATFQLFGRYVANCSHHHTRIRVDAPCWDICLRLNAIQLSQLCQTKVENLYAAISSNEDVVGFEIAVNNSFVMCGCQAIGDLQCVIYSAPLAQGS